MNYFTLDPEELFYREIEMIRSRHGRLFPKEQADKIKLAKTATGYKLTFLEGYELDEGIGMEVDLAFKLIFT